MSSSLNNLIRTKFVVDLQVAQGRCETENVSQDVLSPYPGCVVGEAPPLAVQAVEGMLETLPQVEPS